MWVLWCEFHCDATHILLWKVLYVSVFCYWNPLFKINRTPHNRTASKQAIVLLLLLLNVCVRSTGENKILHGGLCYCRLWCEFWLWCYDLRCYISTDYYCDKAFQANLCVMRFLVLIGKRTHSIILGERLIGLGGSIFITQVSRVEDSSVKSRAAPFLDRSQLRARWAYLLARRD